MSQVSPLTILVMIECYASADPGTNWRDAQWMAADGVRKDLRCDGMITEDNRATPKGEAWVNALCDTPFPVCQWIVPRGET